VNDFAQGVEFLTQHLKIDSGKS